MRPSAIVNAAKNLPIEGWKAFAAPFLRDGKLIHAIKACREHTRWGLKEAKEACEKVLSAHNNQAQRQSA